MASRHPTDRFVRRMKGLRTRATLALIGLWVALGLDVYDIVARQYSISLLREIDPLVGASSELMSRLEYADLLVNFSVLATIAVGLATAVVFLMWVHRIVRLARSLSGEALPWTPARAVWGFFIPFVSLVRPYQVLRDVQYHSDPEAIEDPPVRINRDIQPDYRSVVYEKPPAAKPLPKGFIGAWWGFYILANLVSRFSLSMSEHSSNTVDGLVSSYHVGMFAAVVGAVAAGFAITVVRSLTARLEERFRRLRHSTIESLERQEITLE